MLPPTKITPFRVGYARRLTGKILDCGAGTGAYRSYFSSSDIVSLDYTLSQLRNVPTPKLYADASNLPFKNDVFDGVWNCGVLQYLEGDLRDIINNFIRVTKPNGTIYVLTPNRKSIIDKIKRCLRLPGWASQGPVKKLYSVEELKPFGQVTGEISFLPFLNPLLKAFPGLGHTLMLVIHAPGRKSSQGHG